MLCQLLGLRNSRNLLCTQWQSFWVYEVWSLASFFSLDFRAACVMAGLLSGSTHPVLGDLSCSGMTMLLSETAPLHCHCLNRSPVRETPLFSFLHASLQDLLTSCTWLLGVYHPADFPPPHRGPGLNPYAAGKAGCLCWDAAVMCNPPPLSSSALAPSRAASALIILGTAWLSSQD